MYLYEKIELHITRSLGLEDNMVSIVKPHLTMNTKHGDFTFNLMSFKKAIENGPVAQ